MILLTLILLLSPLVGTLLLLFLRNSSKEVTVFISNISILISFLISVSLLYTFYSLDTPQPISVNVLTFVNIELFSLYFGVYVDSLSLIMSSVVTSVSLLVHYYSISYMKNDGSFNRFFVYTNFFTFSMLLIVLSNNFLQLFIGWELVGLSSYLLIGFWL